MNKLILALLCVGGMAMAKSAVVYFSATGTTKAAAEQIAKITGSDILQIEPKVPYTSADLDWQDKNSRTTKECNDLKNVRPEMAKKLDVSAYNTIYLGFPIWWYQAPNIIYTFVESVDMNGKNIYPFFTSGGSGVGSSVKNLSKKAPKAVWKEAKRISGAVSEKAIKGWN